MFLKTKKTIQPLIKLRFKFILSAPTALCTVHGAILDL